jgi:hypothetical protein
MFSMTMRMITWLVVCYPNSTSRLIAVKIAVSECKQA